MISLAIVSLLAGAVLGWWFTIPILVVAIFMALVVVAGVGAAVASLWWIALDVFVVTMCLQLGYVAGSALETYNAFRAQRRALLENKRTANVDLRPQQLLRRQPFGHRRFSFRIGRRALSRRNAPIGTVSGRE